jgi:hypothetical protein
MYRLRFSSALAMAAMAAILLPSILTAQITFQRTYGGTADEGAQSAVQTTDGGYVITGYTDSYGTSDTSVYLVKTDAAGGALWTKTYGGPGYESGHSVQQTTDGGYIIVGETESFGTGLYDIWLIKTDAAGDTMWTRTYGGVEYELGYSVRQTIDGGYIISGFTYSFGAGLADVYLIKADASGDTTWTRTYGGADNDYGSSVRQTTDGGYIIAGRTWSFGAGPNDLWLIKTDTAGDTMWTKTYGGTDFDWGSSVQQTTDGGYAVAGWTRSFGTGEEDVWLIKADARGDTMWTRTYGGPNWDCSWSVQQTTDGGYIVAGYTSSFGVGGADFYLIRTDAHGDTLWTRTFGGAMSDFAHSVQQTADGGYIIAGSTESYGAGSADAWLIKTDADGNVAVEEPKASPTRAPALSLSCEPNPFRTKTAISLQPTADSQARLAVFDASGRCVRRFTVNRTPCVVWNGTDDFGQPLSSGAYFVRVDAQGEHASTRVVLQR